MLLACTSGRAILVKNCSTECRSKFRDDDSSSFDDDKKSKRMISRLSQQVQDQD